MDNAEKWWAIAMAVFFICVAVASVTKSYFNETTKQKAIEHGYVQSGGQWVKESVGDSNGR